MKEAVSIRGVRVVVETFAGVKPDETVLILCDSTTECFAEQIAEVVIMNNAEPLVMVMLPRKFHGDQLPKCIASAMKSVDVVIALTKFNVAHTEARFSAQAAGVRMVVLSEVTEDLFVNSGIFADFHGLKPKVEKLAKLLTEAKVARVYSSYGTNFTCSLQDRKGRALHGFANYTDISAGFCIEASIAPVEGTGNGTIVVNESIPGIGLIDEPVIVNVKDGYATSITGGNKAKEFRKVLESKNDKLIYNIAELGVGMNPLCKFENSMLSDEGVYGTIHVALGNNAYIGGTTVVNGHYDMVFSNATLELDGVVVLKDGNLVF